MSKRSMTVFGLLLFVSVASAAPAKKPAEKSRTVVVSAEAGRLLRAEETRLTGVLGECAKAKVPKACRVSALDDHARRLSALLTKVHIDPTSVMGGANRDCVGDSEAETKAHCSNGTVEKITVPCTHCTDGYGHDATNRCFLFVCVETSSPGKD